MNRGGLNNNTVESNAMDLLKHLPSPISPTFSEALRVDTRAGSWIFISGQVGVPLPPDKGSIKTYLTDLGPYAVFSRIRGEFFPKDPPTSTAVQVAGLLLNAKIEIDAVAFLPVDPTA